MPRRSNETIARAGMGELFVALLLSLAVLQVHAQTVIYNRDASGVIDRAVVLPPGRLNRSSATVLAREFLDRNRAQAVLSLVIGVDELEVRASSYHRLGDIPSPRQNRMEELKKLVDDISRHGPPKQPIARVISINGNALLSYREGNTVAEEVLRGSDPTRFRNDGVDFELLHLSLSVGTTALAEDVRNSLTLYFRVKPKPSLSSTLAAFHRFASLVKIGNLVVLVRPDAWFLGSDSYPFFPAFVIGLEPPNAIRYELSSYVTCGSPARQSMSCSGKNFKP